MMYCMTLLYYKNLASVYYKEIICLNATIKRVHPEIEAGFLLLRRQRIRIAG